jgi:hypothetical protein
MVNRGSADGGGDGGVVTVIQVVGVMVMEMVRMVMKMVMAEVMEGSGTNALEFAEAVCLGASHPISGYIDSWRK